MASHCRHRHLGRILTPGLILGSTAGQGPDGRQAPQLKGHGGAGQASSCVTGSDRLSPTSLLLDPACTRAAVGRLQALSGRLRVELEKEQCLQARAVATLRDSE